MFSARMVGIIYNLRFIEMFTFRTEIELYVFSGHISGRAAARKMSRDNFENVNLRIPEINLQINNNN